MRFLEPAALTLAVLMIITIFSTTPTYGANPSSFSTWAKNARVAGAWVSPNLTRAEADALVSKMANQNVTVIEADSQLSEYLTDAQFQANLNMMSMLADAAHAKGIKVVVYYPALEVITINGETLPNSMYKDHPDWVQRALDGTPNVYYGSKEFWVAPGAESAWMSPSSPYRDYLYGRLAQIAQTSVDGVWMDVPLLNDLEIQWADTNPYSVAAFKAATGLDTPKTANWNDSTWRRWVAWRHLEIKDFIQGMRDACLSVDSEFTVLIETMTMDWNDATATGLDGSDLKHMEGVTHVWELNPVSDSNGMQKAKEDDWISMIAMNKFARGGSGSKPSWVFSYGKDAADAELVMAEIVAAGNNPFETKVPEMTTTVGEAFRTKMFGWIKDNSSYIYDRETAAKVAVFYSPQSRDYIDQNKGMGLYATTAKPSGTAEWWSTYSGDSVYSMQYLAEYRGIVKALVHSHTPFDTIVNPDLAELQKYESIVFPDVEAMSSAQANMIRAYINGGGKAIFTGPNPTGLNEYGDALGDYQLSDALGFSKGNAAVAQNNYGLGEVRYFSNLPGKNYLTTSDAASFNQLKTAFAETSTNPIATNADRRVHFELARSGNNLVMHMVNFIGMDGTFAVEPTSFNVNLAIPSGKKVASVAITSPDHATSALQPVAFMKNGTSISFDVSLSEYSMAVIELEDETGTAPAVPTATASPTTPTNGSVTVTINYSADSVVKQYKIGSAGAWTNYTEPIVLSSNNTVFFKGQNAAGNWSAEGSIVISNITASGPAAPTLVASPTAPTNGDVTITISYSADSVTKEYKIGAGGAWTAYTGPVTLSANETVYARGKNASGTASEEASLVIANIDKTPPAVPTATATPTTPTNGSVTVTINYSADSVVKQYKIGSAGALTNYTGPIVLSSNNTVFFKGQDAAGNWSAEGSILVDNIGGVTPPSPSSIQIDGDTSDWIDIPVLASSTKATGAKSLKVTSDSDYIYFLIEGTGMAANFDLMLNTDNNTATGYKTNAFTTGGIDYAVESDGNLYAANGNKWPSVNKGKTGVTMFKSATVKEIRLLKTSIANLSGTITIGFLDMDGSWNVKSKVPESGAMVAYTME